MKFSWTLVILFLCPLIHAQNLVYEGTLYDSAGTAVSESGVKVLAEIMEESGTCVLYSRQATLDLSGSSGHFSIDIANEGTAPTGEPHELTTLAQALSNTTDHSLTCSDSTADNYTGSFKKRRIRISILEIDGVDITDIVLPAQNLNMSAYANEAESSRTVIDNAVTSAKIQDGVIASNDFAANAVDAAALADNSVDAGSVQNNAITNAKIATGIDAAKLTGILPAIDGSNLTGVAATGIGANAVGAAELADNAVDTNALQNNAVTNNKVTGVGIEKLLSSAANYFTYEPNNAACAAGEVLKWTASNRWECGADSALAAGNYYTQTNMQTSGQAQLHFNNLTSVPAGLADGDDDTTYSQVTGVANGLMIAADKVKLDGVEANATADQTAAEILTAAKTVDGSASGLDADLLDGQDGPYYLAWGNLSGIPGDLADGDANTQLSEATVDGYANNNGYLTLETQSLDEVYNNGSSVTVDSTDVVYNLSSTQDFHIQDAGGAAFTVTDSGNIGIGITNPNAKLTVEGVLTLDEQTGDPTGTSGYGSVYAKNDGKLYYRDGTGTVTNLLALGTTGTVTQVDAGTGLTGGSITATGTIGLANTSVTGGAYGSATQVPSFTVDAQGRLTTAANITITDNDTTYSQVTAGADGLMIAADKSKLNVIEASATADQTNAEILTAVKAVDGPASGLDADLLDTQSGAYYLDWGNLTGIPSGIADGDDNTQLSEATVDGYANNNGYLTTQSLDAAYDDGSSVTVDSTDMVYNLSSTQDFHIQDLGNPAFTVTDAGRVGIGTTGPSGALDVTSTTGAFIPPRMTETERDNLATPPDGSVVYNTTLNKMNFLENGTWQELDAGGGGGAVPSGMVGTFHLGSCPTGWSIDPDYNAAVGSAFLKLLIHGEDANGTVVNTSADDSPVDTNLFGSAEHSTAQAKFGSGSIDFAPGVINSNAGDFSMLDGNFTIDFWIRFGSGNSAQSIFSKGGQFANGLVIITDTSANPKMEIYADAALIISESTGANLNTWYHYALVRSGTTITLYRDGTSVGSATDSTFFDSGSTAKMGDNLSGWIDEFRILKGKAEWTSNFTPPTLPYLNPLRISCVKD